MGVDGGGTKSHIALFSQDGKCVETLSCGPLNHEVMPGSYTQLRNTLLEVTSEVLGSAGATARDVEYAVFGLAGIDSSGQERIISEIIHQIGFDKLTACNDALLAVAGGSPDCTGIGAINGTGFKLAAIDNSGMEAHTCGVGAFTDDKGGGGWYGERTAGAVYSMMFRSGSRKTIMKSMLFDLLGITDNDDFLEVLTEKLYTDDETNRIDNILLNSIVFNAAAEGDDVALDILNESADSYASAISWLAQNYDFPKEKTLSITFAGSVFTRQKVKLLHEMIENRVQVTLDGRDIEFVTLDVPPVAGAVKWAAQKAGFCIDMEQIKAGISGL